MSPVDDKKWTTGNTQNNRQTISSPQEGQSVTNSPFPFPYTFSEIIEADHDSISHIAGKVLQPSIPLTARLSHLETLLWRLIRHDISEELVMRPTFTGCLGQEGANLAAEDARDHADLKRQLVLLYEQVVRDQRSENVNEGDLVGRVRVLSDRMAEHMRDESGVWLPRLEAHLPREVSLELGRQYAMTLALTPHVCLPAVPGEVDVEPNTSTVQLQRCFADVLAYTKATPEDFRVILGKLEGNAERGGDRYLMKMVEVEMGELQLRFQLDRGGIRREKGTEKMNGKL